MKLHPYMNENEFWTGALKATLKAIEEALATHGHARIGLAGGSTPKKLYEMLSHENLPWEKLTWILVDERYVPADDEESNLRMISSALFKPAHIPEENRVFFDTSLPSLESVKSMASRLHFLEKYRAPLFDLLILGAGKDGHIASLFEGDSSMFSPEYSYAAEAPVVYETTERLTVSLAALCKANKALLLLKGNEKKPVIQALEGEPVLPLTALKHLSAKVPLEVLFCA